jgi:predicted nucleic acid-binding protein
MTSQVCVDASLVLKLVLNEVDSTDAETLWRKWIANQVEIMAPPLFPIEVTAFLRLQVYRGNITLADGFDALQTILSLQIQIRTFPTIHSQAWELADTLNQPRTYDTHYLALALHHKCALWTAGERLYNAATMYYPKIQWMGNIAQ